MKRRAHAIDTDRPGPRPRPGRPRRRIVGRRVVPALLFAVLAGSGFVAAASAPPGTTEIRGLETSFPEIVLRFLGLVENIEGEDLDHYLRRHGLDPESAAVADLRGLRTRLMEDYAERVLRGAENPECLRAYDMGRELARIHEAMAAEGRSIDWGGLLVNVDRENRDSGSIFTTDPIEIYRAAAAVAEGCWAEGVRTVYPRGEVTP